MGDWEALFNKRGKVFLKVQGDMKFLTKFLKKEKAIKVLDLGCGSGRHTVLLAKQGFDVYATDISKAGLKLTRNWLKEEKLAAKVKLASCYESFPFKDDFFDAVISTQTIHHNFHDKILFCISEINRVLKPNGIIFITTCVPVNKYRRRVIKSEGATKLEMPEPHTYLPLDGEEKGLPHFIHTKSLIKKDFKNFQILDLHKDRGGHWCLLGRSTKVMD